MKKLQVVAFLGTPCLLVSEKGDVLAAEVRHQLDSNGQVNVDFGGYEFLSSAFLNHAFGQLCIDMNLDVPLFHNRIRVSGLQEDDAEELELALDNAQTRRTLLMKGTNPDQFFSSRLPA